MFRIIEDLFIRTGLDDLSSVHDGHSVTELGDDTEVVRDHDDRHAFLRKLLAEMYDKNLAETVRILYGGSVKPDNIDALMAQADIDGALVGGAALKIDSFKRIIRFQ